MLPGLNGRRLAEKLLDEQPQMQVLLMSGYTQDAFDADGVLPPGFGFLQKPFSLELLRETIRRRVGSPATL